MADKQPSAPQTAYDTLSAADKEAVNTFIYAQIVMGGAKAFASPSTATSEQLTDAYVLALQMKGKQTSDAPSITAAAEAGIRITRELVAKDPAALQEVRDYEAAMRQQAKEHPEVDLEMGKHTEKTDAIIAIDGDQVDLKPLPTPAKPKADKPVRGQVVS